MFRNSQDRCEAITEALEAMREELWACKRCQLFKGRTQPVIGDGNPCSRIMLVGEAPGRNEDLEGKPFVGKAGRLLDEMLAMIGLDRDKLYITNVVKCKPPNNRDPLPEELLSCRSYLIRQIKLIEPVLVVTLGRFSMWTFLSRGVKISQVHGRAFRKRFSSLELIVFPIYHPAYILRNPHQQRLYRQDFLKLRELIDSLKLTLI